jgi:hypothetical protein
MAEEDEMNREVAYTIVGGHLSHVDESLVELTPAHRAR